MKSNCVSNIVVLVLFALSEDDHAELDAVPLCGTLLAELDTDLLHETGTLLYAWGAGYHGQLGLSSYRKKCKLVPAWIEFKESVLQVACGGFHTAVLTGNALLLYAPQYFSFHASIVDKCVARHEVFQSVIQSVMVVCYTQIQAGCTPGVTADTVNWAIWLASTICWPLRIWWIA